jgi:D-3-phosphoglycerate dehydrogenase / 2-oxoglutarate reductase
MRSRKIIVATSTFGISDAAPLDKLKSSGFEIVSNLFGRKLSKDELRGILPGAVGIIAGLESLSREVLEGSELRVISRVGVGLSNVDLDAARELGIQVCSTPDAPTVSVAELTIGCMISLLRHVPELDRSLRRGNWQKKLGLQLEGKTILIIGFGRIGRRVAALLRSFNVRLVACDASLSGNIDGVELIELSEGLAQADIVTLHASGETEIIGEAQFALLKRGAFLLNVGRGGLINERALCRALDAGMVAGVWLDVFAEEPYTGPLLKYEQVILTPHIGSATAECREKMEMQAVDNLLQALTEHAART